MDKNTKEMATRLRKNLERSQQDYERLERQSSAKIEKLDKMHDEIDGALKVTRKRLLANPGSPEVISDRVLFNSDDFIKLFIAIVRINGDFSIDRDSLKYELCEFCDLEEYHYLFQDFAIKQQVEGDSLDFEEALQAAVLTGLITPHDIHPTNPKRLILLSEEEAQKIIGVYDERIVEDMHNLVKPLLQNNEKVKKKVFKVD